MRVLNSTLLCCFPGDKLETLVAQEAAQQAAASAEVGQLRAHLSAAEAAAAAAQQQADTAAAQLAEAQQALIDADRQFDHTSSMLLFDHTGLHCAVQGAPMHSSNGQQPVVHFSSCFLLCPLGGCHAHAAQ